MDERASNRLRMLERLFETTREGFWYLDDGGMTVELNDAMCSILGRRRDQVLGQSIFAFVDPANRAIIEDQLRRRAGGSAGPFEVALSRPDGHQVACINNETPVRDDAGDVIGSIGLWTNVSALKSAQAELERAKSDAEHASRAKSEFLSALSHELRTPLNSVLGFAQLLERQGEAITERHLGYVRRILAGGRHLQDLVDQVLDLSRIERGELALDAERLEVREMLRESTELVRALAAEHSVTVECHCDTPVVIEADATRFRQVVMNLLSNGIKYNVEGGTVSCNATTVDGVVRITFIDSGVGIPRERQRGLFQPFNRLGREASSIEGTGIGLALTRHLVDAMGGALGYYSEPGVGSMFRVEFPVAPYPAERRARPRPRPAVVPDAPTREALVLYVEDHPDNLKLMEQVLAHWSGCTLISATTGGAGLDLAKVHQPDLIFLDINLPDLPGLEVLERLKSSPITGDTPVVALSALAMESDVSAGLEAGFDYYLTKPLDLGEFAAVLQTFLSENTASGATT